MIAANLPDVDVLVFATGDAVRRVPARAGRTASWVRRCCRSALTLLRAGLGRLAAAAQALTRPGRAAAAPWWLLALSYLALYSHLLLDFLNNYGVRVLARSSGGGSTAMPCSSSIPGSGWCWAPACGWRGGSARRSRPGLPSARPRATCGDARVGRDCARSGRPRMARLARLRADGADGRARCRCRRSRTRSSSTPATHYETGTYRFWSPRLRLDAARIPKNDDAPEVAAARTAPAIRSFLVWSRFPFWQMRRTEAGTVVTVQ